MSYPAISLATATVGRYRCPQKRLQTARQPPVYPNSSPRIIAPVTPSPPSAALTPSIPVHRWIRAKEIKEFQGGLAAYTSRLQGLLEERFFGNAESAVSLPLIDAADLSRSTNDVLQAFDGISEASFQSQEGLLGALEEIVGSGNAYLDADGILTLNYRTAVIDDRVEVSETRVWEERLLVSSDDPIDLTVNLDMSARLGLTADGDFFVDNSADRFLIDIQVDQVLNAIGRLGFVEIEAPGSVAVLNAAISVDLRDDADGKTTLLELHESSTTEPADVALTGVARLELPTLSLRHGALPGVTAGASIQWADIGNPWETTLDSTDLAATGLRRFRSIDAWTFVYALNEVARAFKDNQHHGLLNATLPLTNRSMADLVNAGAGAPGGGGPAARRAHKEG